MKIGILELTTTMADTLWKKTHGFIVKKQYAAITPQAISVWCRQMGHDVYYATYYGIGDPKSKLPDDLDYVFISAHSDVAPLAYALSILFRRDGTLSIIGGPHAKSFPEDCLRYFDLVVLECDQSLIADIFAGNFEPQSIISSQQPYDDIPTLEERLPEIEASVLVGGKTIPTTWISMLASVGCPYNCNFCIDWDSTYRVLSADRLEQDLRFAAKKFPKATLVYFDPNFGIRFDDVMEIFKRIPKELRNRYAIESSLTNLRADRLAQLRDTNCMAIAPGIESWNEYSNKAGVGKKVGRVKLEMVLEQYHQLKEYVPYLQANFILGLDHDEGDEPFALTKEFIQQTPFVWPNLKIPIGFGGTPLFDDLHLQNRILKNMPYVFYTMPFLSLIIKNYDPITYMEKMVDLYGFNASNKMLSARMKVKGGSTSMKVANAFRTTHVKTRTKAMKIILDFMRKNADFLAFHMGKNVPLPDYYLRYYKKIMGKYAELVPAGDGTPKYFPLRNDPNRDQMNTIPLSSLEI